MGRSSAARGVAAGIGVAGGVGCGAGLVLGATVALGTAFAPLASAACTGGGASARCCSALGGAAGFGFSSLAAVALVTLPAPSTSRRINSEPTAIVSPGLPLIAR